MRKKWNELSPRGKNRRLAEIRYIVDEECLTYDFWKALSKHNYDLARRILMQTINYSKKLGYHYAKNDEVVDLLA